MCQREAQSQDWAYVAIRWCGWPGSVSTQIRRNSRRCNQQLLIECYQNGGSHFRCKAIEILVEAERSGQTDAFNWFVLTWEYVHMSHLPRFYKTPGDLICFRLGPRFPSEYPSVCISCDSRFIEHYCAPFGPDARSYVSPSITNAAGHVANVFVKSSPKCEINTCKRLSCFEARPSNVWPNKLLHCLHTRIVLRPPRN